MLTFTRFLRVGRDKAEFRYQRRFVRSPKRAIVVVVVSGGNLFSPTPLAPAEGKLTDQSSSSSSTASSRSLVERNLLRGRSTWEPLPATRDEDVRVPRLLGRPLATTTTTMSEYSRVASNLPSHMNGGEVYKFVGCVKSALPDRGNLIRGTNLQRRWRRLETTSNTELMNDSLFSPLQRKGMPPGTDRRLDARTVGWMHGRTDRQIEGSTRTHQHSLQRWLTS